jgi:magnesium chelatase subunit I
MRKDPLDPIDNGIKVAIAFNRVADPDYARKEEEREKKKAAAAAAAEAAPKKAGAWAGLPGGRR